MILPDVFYVSLFSKLASGVTPREMCSATVLNGIVGKALQLSVYSDTTEHAQNLAFALKSLPEIFKPNGKSTIICPRLLQRNHN